MSSAPRRSSQDASTELDPKIINAASFKGPKRKRLLKACDACHKSKRRCDGTAPCSNCYFASKDCSYTDASGRRVPAPNAPRPELAASSSMSAGPSAGIDAFPHELSSPDTVLSGPLTTAPLKYPNLITAAGAHASSLHVQSNTGSGSHHESGSQDARIRSHSRKRAREQQDVEGLDNFKDEPSQQSFAATHDARHSQMRNTSLLDIRTSTPWHPPNPGGVPSANQTGIDRSVMRELVNLFFAHCHPQRLIIHSPTFLNDLYIDRVPAYLLHAVCAVAAPLSRNPTVRTPHIRQAGQRFATAALESMFDSQQRLKVPADLQTAQALALLQSYMMYAAGHMDGEFHLFNIAFRILDDLNIHAPASSSSGGDLKSPSLVDPNHPILTPMPTPEIWFNAVQRECARRTFWFIHLIELLGFLFVRRRPTHSPRDLKRVMAVHNTHKVAVTGPEVRHSDSQAAGLHIRLPCSEAEFEVSVYSALPEYLNNPAPKTRSASEFGHVIRILTILNEIEECNVDEPDAKSVIACDERLKSWASGLSENLQYSQDNLEFQLSLWETSSNTSTWCYCFIHVLHACCILALNDIQRRLGREQSHEYGGALNAVLKIMSGIGPRARNSIILGCVLWLQYCGPHVRRPNDVKEGLEGSATHAHKKSSKSPNVPELQSNLEGWIKEWEEIWGPTQEAHTQSVAQEKLNQQQQSSTTGVPDSAMPGRQRVVPEVVIDPLLRNDPSEGAGRSSGVKMSTQSQGLAPNSLPSLKASGLLDVAPPPDEAGPQVGTSSKWSTNAVPVSPRAPLRSPVSNLLPHPQLSHRQAGGSTTPISGPLQQHFASDVPGGSSSADPQWHMHAMSRQIAVRTHSSSSTLPTPQIIVPSHNNEPRSPRRQTS